MVEVPVPVKDHFLDPFFEAFLGNQISDFLRRIHIPRIFDFLSKLWTQRGGTGQRLSLGIGDRLDIDVPETPKDIETGPFRGSLDAASHPSLSFRSAYFLNALQSFSSLPASACPLPGSSPGGLLGFGLSYLFANPLSQIPDPLSFIRFRGFDRPKLGGDGTDLLFVDPLMVIQGLLFNLRANALRKGERNGVENPRLSLSPFPSASARKPTPTISVFSQILGHARDHIGDQAS
jgi:hypothetical protein